MSRDEAVEVVERFLECLVTKDLTRLPVIPEVTAESPLLPRVSGTPALDYIKAVASVVKSIHIEQHIVEGDHVATFLIEDTLRGRLPVFAKFRLEADRIADVRVFYDSGVLSARQ
jgi:hypothetical protein